MGDHHGRRADSVCEDGWRSPENDGTAKYDSWVEADSATTTRYDAAEWRRHDAATRYAGCHAGSARYDDAAKTDAGRDDATRRGGGPTTERSNAERTSELKFIYTCPIIYMLQLSRYEKDGVSNYIHNNLLSFHK